MKKTLLSVLIITIFVQILIPTYMIWGKYDVLKNGEEVKVKVAPIDPYDAFRGRYVSLWYDNDLSYEQRQGKYGILEIDGEGFATVKKVEKELNRFIKNNNAEKCVFTNLFFCNAQCNFVS